MTKEYNNKYYKSKVDQVFHTLYATTIDNITYIVFKWHKEGFIGYCELNNLIDAINNNLLVEVSRNK